VSGTTIPKSARSAKPKAATGTVSAAVEENTTVDAAQAEPEALTEKEGNEIEQVDTTRIAGSDAQLNDCVISVLGTFKVRAKSADGFWRSGVQFHRIQEKLVFVVGEEPDAASRIHAKGYEPEHVVYLAVEKAKRVHSEPNLAIEEVELADVIDLSDTE
jgi:hypothetical protein